MPIPLNRFILEESGAPARDPPRRLSVNTQEMIDVTPHADAQQHEESFDLTCRIYVQIKESFDMTRQIYVNIQ